jgi:hypothetical protein
LGFLLLRNAAGRHFVTLGSMQPLDIIVLTTHQRQQCGQSTDFEFVYCPACDTPIIVTLCHYQNSVQARPMSIIIFLRIQFRNNN